MNHSKQTTGIVALQPVSDVKKSFSRVLRKTATEAENALWTRLRGRQLVGLKFRRQQVIDGFIADFFCEEAKLVIEVDGGIHKDVEQQHIDRHRDESFADKGLQVLRLTNDDVLQHMEACLLRIIEAAERTDLTPVCINLTPQPPLRPERGRR